MSGPLPVTVVSGYLGAGKTTLVNHLLAEAHGRRLTVLVNDFGEIALDESLIVNRDGDTIALANGCMCCSIGGDLFDALDRILRAEPRAEHLIIETSGVADPARIAAIAQAEPEMRPALTATLIDAVNFEAGLADPLLADTLERQARASDLLLISKTDRAEAAGLAALAARLDALAPGAPRLEAPHGRAPLELLLDAAERPPAGDPAPDHDHDHDHVHDHDHEHAAQYRSWSWSGAEAVDRAGLEALLAEAPALGLYRLKGVVRLRDGAWAELHAAGREHAVTEVPAPDGGTAGGGEAGPPPGRAVAIGPAARFDAEALEARWRALLG